MYKSKLQEFCQKRSWELPEYVITKEGVDHCPQFKASVVVNGASYFTPDFSKSSREAQNLAAQLAFEHLSAPSNASPTSPISASSKQSERNETVQAPSNASPTSPVSASSKQSEGNETVQASSFVRKNAPSIADKKQKDVARICKNQLQIYAQKRKLNPPVYIPECEGPLHMPRFKCKVVLDGETYDSQEYFGTLKDAENAAANIALMSLSPDGIEEEDPAVFKNLLQERAQKDYSCLPEYSTISSGPPHSPIFVSTVVVKEEFFTGLEAKTKKLAELYAAKVAYSALKERKLKQISECEVPGVDVPPRSSLELQSIVMAESPQRTIPDLHLGFNEASAGHALLTKDIDAYQKGSDSKYVPGQLEGGQSSNQMNQTTEELKVVESLPFQLESSYSSVPPTQSPFALGLLRENSETWVSPHPSSPQKKVKVFPRSQYMTLPPGVNIEHEDDKWVAVTMDSGDSNA